MHTDYCEKFPIGYFVSIALDRCVQRRLLTAASVINFAPFILCIMCGFHESPFMKIADTSTIMVLHLNTTKVSNFRIC